MKIIFHFLIMFETRAQTSHSTFLNALVSLSFFAALFFIFTNGIPLIQLGILKELGSKMRYVRTMQISASIFFFLLILARWLRPDNFKRLWVTGAWTKLTQLPLWIPLACLYLIYSVSSIAVGFMRHAALETRAFDLGIFAQALWNTIHGDFLYSSLKGGICLLGDHVSPILVLVAPFYKLWADPRMLLILQPLFSASCIFFVAYLAYQKTNDKVIALIFALIYWLYPGTRNALHEDFHPEALVEPFIFMAFIFLEKRRLLPFFLSVLVIVMGKENMFGISFVLGIYAFFFKGMRKTGSVLMILSVVLFAVALYGVVPALSGARYFYQGSYGGTLTSFASSLFRMDTLEYVLKVFSPFLFLPFFHFPTLILAFPVLLQNILSSNPLMRSFGYHYTIGLTPFLFISAIFGFIAVCQKFAWLAKYKRLFAALILLIHFWTGGPSEYYYFWQSGKHLTDHHELLREKLREIPERFSVLTHNNLIPQLSNRKEVYQFSYTSTPTKSQAARQLKADYVIFDQRYWEPSSLPLDQSLSELLQFDYFVEFQQEGFYILRKS
ncbi:MAG: DUF2079 domain-containing protein [Candidatus Omnitrophica bacterium]|nr:DUF2079 domain-containing protein [Candidatus Omnitrophota bacterium]